MAPGVAARAAARAPRLQGRHPALEGHALPAAEAHGAHRVRGAQAARPAALPAPRPGGPRGARRLRAAAAAPGGRGLPGQQDGRGVPVQPHGRRGRGAGAAAPAQAQHPGQVLPERGREARAVPVQVQEPAAALRGAQHRAGEPRGQGQGDVTGAEERPADQPAGRLHRRHHPEQERGGELCQAALAGGLPGADGGSPGPAALPDELPAPARLPAARGPAAAAPQAAAGRGGAGEPGGTGAFPEPRRPLTLAPWGSHTWGCPGVSPVACGGELRVWSCVTCGSGTEDSSGALCCHPPRWCCPSLCSLRPPTLLAGAAPAREGALRFPPRFPGSSCSRRSPGGDTAAAGGAEPPWPPRQSCCAHGWGGDAAMRPRAEPGPAGPAPPPLNGTFGWSLSPQGCACLDGAGWGGGSSCFGSHLQEWLGGALSWGVPAPPRWRDGAAGQVPAPGLCLARRNPRGLKRLQAGEGAWMGMGSCPSGDTGDTSPAHGSRTRGWGTSPGQAGP